MQNNSDKIIDADELVRKWQLDVKPNLNEGLGFTNGCFDVVHVGHLGYLFKAKSYVERLVVGLNSDHSVRKLKGCERPINNQFDRAKFLTFFPFVDYVVIFDEDTPELLIRKLRPSVLIKGADYKDGEIAGSEFLKRNGGKVILESFLEGYSTTNLIKKIKGTE